MPISVSKAFTAQKVAQDKFEPHLASLENGNLTAFWLVPNLEVGNGNYSVWSESIDTKTNSIIPFDAPRDIPLTFFKFSPIAATQVSGNGVVTSYVIYPIPNYELVDPMAEVPTQPTFELHANFMKQDGSPEEGIDRWILSSGPIYLAGGLDLADLGDGHSVMAYISDGEHKLQILGLSRDETDAGNTFGPIAANPGAAEEQLDPSVAKLSFTRFAIAWEAVENGLTAIRARVFERDVGFSGDTKAFSNSFAVSSSGNTCVDPEVAGLNANRLAVTWTSDTGGASGRDVHMRLFTSNGAPVSADMVVHNSNAGDQFKPNILSLEDGRVIVVWLTSNEAGHAEARASFFNSEGARLGEEMRLASVQGTELQQPDLAHLKDGRVAVAWTTETAVVGEKALQIRYIDPSKYDGTGSGDNWLGGRGADKIAGNGGNDYLAGGAGMDVIDGGAGNDTITGGLGKDKLNGGAGADKFVYEGKSSFGDTINHFAANDVFSFKGVALGLPTGRLDPHQFVSQASGHTAGDANDRFIYDQNLDQLWFDTDGTGFQKAVLVADMAIDSIVTAKDIFVI